MCKMARNIFGKFFALIYAAAAGVALFFIFPEIIVAADAYVSGTQWIIFLVCAVLLAAAIAVSLPLRGILYLSRASCGKFFAISCSVLVGLPVTYALWLMIAFDFSSAAVGWLYITFGGIAMFICPIVAMYKYID